MRFTLVDRVLECGDDRIVALKQVTRAEEYLGDHFPGFPVLPGVMMLEAMVQAARHLVAGRSTARLVLGSVRALKYGAMVRPGDGLLVEVQLTGEQTGGDGSVRYEFKGAGRLRSGDGATEPTAVSGRFSLRPVRV